MALAEADVAAPPETSHERDEREHEGRDDESLLAAAERRVAEEREAALERRSFAERRDSASSGAIDLRAVDMRPKR